MELAKPPGLFRGRTFDTVNTIDSLLPSFGATESITCESSALVQWLYIECWRTLRYADIS